jgi:SEC-C motif-containing protein
MRSRYSAYVIGDRDYLLLTWHPETRPATLHLTPEQKWLGLKVRNAAAGAPDDSNGSVEFVARYKVAGKGYRLHEKSRFVRLDERWVYLDGEQVSRN